MFTVAILLAIMATVIEVIVVMNIPPLWNLMRKSSVLNLALSLMICWLISFLFAATGTTVLVGSLMAMAACWTIYRTFNVYAKACRKYQELRHKCLPENKWQ